jgi:O-antigen/teichoic acid export membrane protein
VLAQAGRVVLPTFSRLQHDRARLSRAFLNVTESVALVLCPAMTLVILVAPVGVPAVVGEAWVGAVVPLQIIAAMTVQYVIGAFMGPLKIAVGRADWEFRWSVVTMVVALVVFPFALRWGIVGVAASYMIMLCVLNPIRFKIIQRLVPISAGSYVRALAPAMACSVALAIVWLLTNSLVQGATSGLVPPTIASVTGSVAYVVVLRLGWPDDLRRQLDFARLVVRGVRT